MILTPVPELLMEDSIESRMSDKKHSISIVMEEIYKQVLEDENPSVDSNVSCYIGIYG